MPLSHTSNISFNPGDFISAAPIGGTYATQTLGVNNVPNVKWANKTRQINLGNTNYGYVTLDLSYTVTGNADTVGVSFYNSSYVITYSTTLSGLFKPTLPGQYIKLTPGVTTRLYLIVNYEDKKSPFVPLTISVGRKGTLPSNVTVNIGYDCTDIGALYQYLVGMHVYSAYDALNNPTLQTYLYSYTPIGSWTTNTEIYSKGNFTHPAYPYYYGYGGNVYKVGDELERSFGIKKYYRVTKRGIGKTKIFNKINGPKSWIGLDTDGNTTENFVFPTMNNIGYLRQIIPSSNLIQPSSYRYYLGAASTQQASADFFTQFDFTNRAIHTIPGFQHAVAKLSTGFLDGYRGSLPSRVNIIPELITIGLSIVDALIGYDPTFSAPTLGSKIKSFLIIVDQLLNFTASGSLFAGSTAANNAVFLPLPIPLIAIIIAIAVVSLIIKLFNKIEIDIEEPSITWKYRYANTPYLNNGNILYTDTGLTTKKSEYYCDGIYFYDHLDQVIMNKELSYSTNALLNTDPLTKGLAYSSRADQPDSGSIITDLSKLIALPYCSGKPDTVTGTNKNTTQSTSFTPQIPCGDLLDTPSTVTVTVPAGIITTTGSQASADSEALLYLNRLTASYSTSGSYSTPKAGVSGFGSYFTHEIKVETYPNIGSVFFDNSNGAGLTVGKYLYYDNGGCLKVLNGYYAANSGSVNSYSNYRTFFKTSNGAVIDILAMVSSGDTTVTSLINSATYPVQTTNQGYTSDWFWYNLSYSDLTDEVANIVDTNTNPNSLYTTSSLKSGFVNQNTSSFYTYDSISSTASYSEAASGYYYSFNSYETPYIFSYSTPIPVTINLTEVCFTNYSIGQPYGINISGASGSASSSLYYPVNMTLKAYNGGTLLATFPATASADGITYVSFPSPITKDSNVTNVVIESISSPNPNNKVSYLGGSFTNCNPSTPAPTTAAPTTAAPTTAAPTTAPTTAAPTTAPTTAAPTPSPTNPFGGNVYYSTISAAYTCDSATTTISVTGNNGTFCTSTQFNGEGWSTLAQGTYWIKWIGSNDVVAVYHGAGSSYATRLSGGCEACPTPSPTTAPTTAAPTTAAPTTAPTTAAPTTAAPTMLVTELSGFISLVDGIQACDGGEYGDIRIDVYGTTICDATSIVYLPTSVWADMVFNQPFWVSDKVGATFKSRSFRRNGNNNTASPLLGCEECPTPSPTAAPTTAAPTTAAPTTAAPTTAAPTTPPTPPPTTSPTPSPTASGGNCYNTTYTGYAGCTVYWKDCNGTNRSQFINANTPTSLGCIQFGSVSGCGSVTYGTDCGDFTPAPTPNPTTPPTPPPTTPPTPPPTPPPTTPPTPPPTPPPTTPPTPPPTTPPTPPPTPSPTFAPYFYYEATPCFSGGNLIVRSTDDGLNGVYVANGTCYIIQGISFPQAYSFDIDPLNYQGGSCYVSGCGYTPPPVPPPTADYYSCEPFVGCYPDQFSNQSFGECNKLCPQP